jgi:hypothetical protein
MELEIYAKTKDELTRTALDLSANFTIKLFRFRKFNIFWV